MAYTELNKPGITFKEIPPMDEKQALDIAASRAHMRKMADRAHYLGDAIAAAQFDMDALEAEKSLIRHGYDPETGEPR